MHVYACACFVDMCHVVQCGMVVIVEWAAAGELQHYRFSSRGGVKSSLAYRATFGGQKHLGPPRPTADSSPRSWPRLANRHLKHAETTALQPIQPKTSSRRPISPCSPTPTSMILCIVHRGTGFMSAGFGLRGWCRYSAMIEYYHSVRASVALPGSRGRLSRSSNLRTAPSLCDVRAFSPTHRSHAPPAGAEPPETSPTAGGTANRPT